MHHQTNWHTAFVAAVAPNTAASSIAAVAAIDGDDTDVDDDDADNDDALDADTSVAAAAFAAADTDVSDDAAATANDVNADAAKTPYWTLCLICTSKVIDKINVLVDGVGKDKCTH